MHSVSLSSAHGLPQVKEALGMGVGVGGYVMARAALSKPSIFIGLVLASPPFEGPTVYERVVS